MNKQNKEKMSVLEITKIAAVVAIVLLLGLTPIGFIPIGALQITTVHIVVIIIAILLGVKYGLIAGLTFGISSILTALITPNAFTPIFLNPLVSVVPRVILPLVAAFLFIILHKILRRKSSPRMSLAISSMVAAGIATLVHTILVLALIWMFKGMAGTALPSETLLTIIIGLLTVNMPLEILFAVIGAGLMVPILYPWLRKSKVATPEIDDHVGE